MTPSTHTTVTKVYHELDIATTNNETMTQVYAVNIKKMIVVLKDC